MNLELFDLLSYLSDRSIPFVTQGKNVGAGWIGVNCPFCGDPSHHMGINLIGKYIHCWRCGTKGNVIRLIKKWEDCTYKRVEEILSEFVGVTYLESTELKSSVPEVALPREASSELHRPAREYLVRRGFDPDALVLKYQIRSTPEYGDWKYRIVIPVLVRNRVVTFTARDYTGLAPITYKSCPNVQSAIPIKQCLYNVDSVFRRAVIVEGVFDVWRIGDGAVALFGTSFTTGQVNLLVNKKLEAAFVMFDGEANATKEAYKLAHLLSPFIPHVEVIEMEEDKDPADLSEAEAQHWRRALL